jgi:hypothetical protein
MKTSGFKVVLVSVVLVFVLSLSVSATETPFKFDESWSVNVGYFMAKIDKIFFQGKFAEENPNAAKVKFFLDKLGLLSLKDNFGEFKLDETGLYYTETMTLDPTVKDSLIAKIVGLPNRQLRVGEILNPENTLITLSITNPIEKAEILWDMVTDESILNECEQVTGSTPEFQQIRMGIGMADMMLTGIGGFEAIKSVVGDEIDIVLVEFPDGDMTAPDYPWDKMVFVLTVALDDSKEFMKLASGGSETMFKDEPVFTANGIPFYNTPQGVLMGVGKGFLIAGSGGNRLKEVLDSNRPWANAPAVSGYIRIDLNKIWYQLLEPLTRNEAIPYPQYAIAMHKELWDITPETNFGALEISARTEQNRIVSETKARPEIVNLFGFAYTMMVAIGVSSAESQAGYPDVNKVETNPLDQMAQSRLAEIESALGNYYLDKGAYPRTVDTLIADSYIADFPLNAYNEESVMTPKLLTNWSAGDFAYIPEIKDDIVVGYHLFLFGNERYGGMDVVSAKNAFPAWHWEADSDGKPDGIILILESPALEPIYND